MSDPGSIPGRSTGKERSQMMRYVVPVVVGTAVFYAVGTTLTYYSGRCAARRLLDISKALLYQAEHNSDLIALIGAAVNMGTAQGYSQSREVCDSCAAQIAEIRRVYKHIMCKRDMHIVRTWRT